ncbi:DUF3035 domain-containing protein [Asticcacaulis sp. AND118]|uniref:DUF3035 domain-containing protein n=1 Tax=Asticcacaulis sp. AND118 TaxID=2840468 RepID=UPI001CFFD617|nr:DUF3035 domain-containing protein [Asticcacaulis sp. AND118]UDF04496.1 DUF3035 domain-containing protein [Asticcacaulis sp. AND118]
MKSVKVVAGLVLIAGVGLTGCNSTKSALGLNKVVPDEFRVVTKAPLVVPPDFALRPPAPGEPRPQELQPESAAREALLGQRQAIMRSEGEKVLATKAGADKADPLARYVVDDEFGDLAYKEEGFADKILFWKKDTTPAPAPSINSVIAGEVNAIDPDAEAARIKSLLGDGKVTIEQKKEKSFKLPGL